MCDILQAACGGRARLALLLCASVSLGAPRPAEAHNVLSEFIQHGIQLTVGAHYIDVTVDLAFFEEWSSRERGAMDADGSGNVTSLEQEAYLKKLAPQLSRNVKLCVAGRELTLVPLYDPEIDLLADNKVGPAHHRLRLFYFASTPELRDGDEIVIENRLWLEAKALATPQAEGRDGCKLTALVRVDATLATPSAQEEKRLFKFRCEQPPTKAAKPGTTPVHSGITAGKASVSPQQAKPSATCSDP